MATLKPKVYLATVNDEEVLVRALTRAAAIAHIAARTIEVEVASSDDIIRLTKLGIEVDDATVEPEPEPVVEGEEPVAAPVARSRRKRKE